MSLHPDYEDMLDFQYAEEHPGYQREDGLTASDLEDCGPDVALLVADKYAHDNAKRRESNLRTENARLRALLTEHGIEISEEN